MSTSRHKDLVPPYSRAYTDSPRSSHRPDASTNNPSTNSKPPPTGPRAHKRPRLSEPQPSPPVRPMAPLPPKPQIQHHSHHPHSHSHSHHNPHGPQLRQANNVHDKDNARHNKPNTNNSLPNQHHNPKMELDDAGSSRPASPAAVRDRDRAREREKNNKERERRDRESRDLISNDTGVALPSKPPPANTTGRRNGSNPSGRASGGTGGAGGGTGSGRKTTNSTNSASGSHNQSSESRTLQERMGL